jgi:predicted nucleic acid-binding protein
VSAVLLDTGALVAIDGDDRSMVARLKVARSSGFDLRTTGVIVAEAWRDPSGRQANLSRLLKAVDVRAVDDAMGRDAGLLLGRSGLRDAPDATLVTVAASGDRIVTADPDDIRRLVAESGRAIGVVPC